MGTLCRWLVSPGFSSTYSLHHQPLISISTKYIFNFVLYSKHRALKVLHNLTPTILQWLFKLQMFKVDFICFRFMMHNQEATQMAQKIRGHMALADRPEFDSSAAMSGNLQLLLIFLPFIGTWSHMIILTYIHK